MQVSVKSKLDRVGEYLTINGYKINRMDIHGMTATGFYEFAVDLKGEFVTTWNKERKEFERVRTHRAWKQPEHGAWVARELS